VLEDYFRRWKTGIVYRDGKILN